MAFIVILGHGAMPNLDLGFISADFDKIVNGLLNNTAVGIAAVMGFFVISGFVIHYPYSEGKKLKIINFYTKRLVRISIPAIIAYLVYLLIFSYYMGVIWSLICEAIYYVLYPIFLRFIRRINLIIVLSFILSFGISLYYSVSSEIYNGDFHRNGYWLTWIVGLPIWLLGVKLAEEYKSFSKKEFTNYNFLNLLRITVWFFSIFASILRFQLSVSYVYTLPIYSILIYYWLKKEILYYQNKDENKLLAFGGIISYSIYLVHALIIHIIEKGFGVESLSSYPLLCFLAIVASLLISYLFYLLIEKPTHNLARFLGKKI